MSESEEWFDVVNEHDEVLRAERRSVVHARKLFHRAVHVLLFDAQGRVLLQRRSMSKDTCPGAWTTSASGHVDSGEDYAPAAVREVREELGLAVPGPGSLEFLFAHRPHQYTGNEFIRVYRLDWDGSELTADPREVSGIEWTEPAQLEARIAQERRRFTPSLRLIWGLYRQRPAPVAAR